MMRFTALTNVLLTLVLVNGTGPRAGPPTSKSRREPHQKRIVGATEVAISVRGSKPTVRSCASTRPNPWSASNMKLFTSGRPYILGEEFHFQTSLILDQDTLWVGGGDSAQAIRCCWNRWTTIGLLDRWSGPSVIRAFRA